MVLLLWAAEPTLTFLGDVATAEEHALRESRLTCAFVGWTVLAVAGLALGIGGRRPGWAVVFVVALLVVSAAWIAETAQGAAPPADDDLVPCVERSGGGNRCPGEGTPPRVRSTATFARPRTAAGHFCPPMSPAVRRQSWVQGAGHAGLVHQQPRHHVGP